MSPAWIIVFLLELYFPASAYVPTQDLSLIDELTSVTLPVPVGISGTEFVWEWTPHDGRFKKVQLVTAKRSKSSPGAQYSWTKTSEHNIYYTNFDDGGNGILIIKSKFENAGHYTFKQIQPNSNVLAMFEVFAFKSVPFRWDSVPPGVDVTRVCTISRLPESSRLQWKLNRSLSAATKCHYNNTAVIIIQNVDEHSTGNYSCDLLKKETYLRGFYNRLTLKTFSVEPPGVLAIGDEATLTCTVSGVHERIRLVWLRDDDGTVVTVKEETLSASASNRSLALFISRIGTEQLKWACVVFQESLPSAYFPIEINAEEMQTAFGDPVLVIVSCVCLVCLKIFIIDLVICLLMKYLPGPVQINPCVDTGVTSAPEEECKGEHSRSGSG
ncbi:uncharacterized protein LOC117426278 isoform X2 [Acipenser ruthenus]|uniref:uncharacterized protein LOC117426278 isoform X2 n=1 Tax=Acipenser ruthenus TaxID=7906 RepID=UPI0027411546|nr:uncharacterized protein LOC117426278 isoform X2 [Acipenser ruthenus]